MIRSAVAAQASRLVHAHSDRSDGPVGNSTVPRHAENRAALVRGVRGDPASLVVPHQVHGARVAAVGARDAGTTIPSADALATADAGVPLLVQGADCPLALVADASGGAVCVLHSGWRGTVARIGAAAVERVASFGARRRDLVAAVFPGIGACCFEIGPDVVGAFRATFGPRADDWLRPGAAGTDRSRLDLAAAIEWTLLDAGVERTRIDVVGGCTACDGRFYSHRGSRGGPERHGLVAVLTG